MTTKRRNPIAEGEPVSDRPPRTIPIYDVWAHTRLKARILARLGEGVRLPAHSEDDAADDARHLLLDAIRDIVLAAPIEDFDYLRLDRRPRGL